MLVIDNVFYKSTMLKERNDERFTLVFDMDNTLFNETGGKQRPNIEKSLTLLKKNRIKMVVWTNSTRQRAEDILLKSKISQYFYGLITRESYMVSEIKKREAEFYKKIEKAFPKEVTFQSKYDSGKNLSLLGYDVLIDDNPQVKSEAAFWGNMYSVMVCEPYISGKTLNYPEQIEHFAKEVIKEAKPGIFTRLFSR